MAAKLKEYGKQESEEMIIFHINDKLNFQGSILVQSLKKYFNSGKVQRVGLYFIFKPFILSVLLMQCNQTLASAGIWTGFQTLTWDYLQN